MNLRHTLCLLAVALIPVCGVAENDAGNMVSNSVAVRNIAWAEPLTVEGLPNLHKVSDMLYRGAQPTAEGFKALKKMGIKTVVNLRAFHSDRDEIGDTQLAYEHIPINTWMADRSDIVQFLRIATDKSKQPVFVHCKHGADRTGTMCAVYRMVVQGWTKESAIEEMTKGGFGFHEVWQNLIDLINGLNAAELKKALEKR